MMKYKRGSIVEVLTTDKVPSHSWRCAQIVSCNRLNYTVRYDIYQGLINQEKEEENVSRKFIRPCPPIIKISEYYPGDIVEVFHNLSWKMVIVSKTYNRDLFLVRLVGSFIEIEASKSELRVRQSWQNNKWVRIGNRNKISKRNLKKERETDDGDSVTSSVGSCGFDNRSGDFEEDIESRDSDGESVCEGGYHYQEKVCLGTEIHRLELQAYRRTIEALHASGPLSWEKESMAQSWRLVNLNDECSSFSVGVG